MMGSLERRFSSHTNQILQCFGVLNPKNFVDRQHQYNIEFLIDYFDPIALRREFDILKRNESIQSCKYVEQVLKLMYQKNLMLAYPNLTIVCRLCLTLPVTTASVERSFSKLKLVKNVLRSTMSEPRLSSLLVLSVERDVLEECNLVEVVETFSSVKSCPSYYSAYY